MQVEQFTNENTRYARLRHNESRKTDFETIQYVFSTTQIETMFTIVQQLPSVQQDVQVFAVTDAQRKKRCVLKIIALEATEQRYIDAAFSAKQQNGVCGDDQQQQQEQKQQLRYSCWVELNALRLARQMLQRKTIMCISYLYTAFIIENKQNNRLQLAICTEFLSNITLSKWLRIHIFENHILRSVTDCETESIQIKVAIAKLKLQFSNLFLHILVTLHYLQSSVANLSQNDLHIDNILMVQSRETCENFVYVVGENYYVATNSLGGFLRQIPILCDFGMATSRDMKNSESLHEYYYNTQRCAYHNSIDGRRKHCYQKVFCDITRLLNDVYDLLITFCSGAAATKHILLESFDRFNNTRKKLNYYRQHRCVSHLQTLQQVIEETFTGFALPVQVELMDAIIFNYNNSKSEC